MVRDEDHRGKSVLELDLIAANRRGCRFPLSLISVFGHRGCLLYYPIEYVRGNVGSCPVYLYLLLR